MAGGMYNFKTSSVVQLTSDNFRSMVLDSKETWYADGASRLALYVTTLPHCFKAMLFWCVCCFRRLTVGVVRLVVSDSGDGVLLVCCPLRVGGVTLCPSCALHFLDIVIL